MLTSRAANPTLLPMHAAEVNDARMSQLLDLLPPGSAIDSDGMLITVAVAPTILQPSSGCRFLLSPKRRSALALGNTLMS
jgi:hypothetical protein